MLPSRLSDDLRRASRCLVRWDARDASLDTVQGHTGTLVRAATGTAVDSNGTTYTAVHSQPRWEMRDDIGTRDAIGLRLAADDLTWPVAPAPAALTAYVACWEVATRTTTGAGLLYLGNAGQTGGRLLIDSTGTNYRATLHDGSTSQSATLATGTPAVGAYTELLLTVTAAGLVTLTLAVNGGAPVSAVAGSALTLPAAWGTGAVLRVNRVGSAGTQGSTCLRRVKVAAGVHDLYTMRGLP